MISTQEFVLKIKALIIDYECFYDASTFQSDDWDGTNVKIFTMKSDGDFIRLYKSFCKANKSMYEFSIGYDRAMINALCKFVEKGVTNIAYNLRVFNNYLINRDDKTKKDYSIDYFKLNREFWCNLYFPSIEREERNAKRNNTKYDKVEIFEECVYILSEKYSHNPYVGKFLKEFPMLLGKSKVFKQMNFIDIPRMLGFFTIPKDGKIKPNISLKDLQLHLEKKNLKFDFFKYKKLEDVVRDGYEELFKSYAANDITSLKTVFKKMCLKIVKTRVYACEAIKKFNPEFVYTDDMIHSEKNTNLLVNAFSLPPDKLEHVEFNMLDYIKPTGYEKFDRLVKFVAEHGSTFKKDRDLKEAYCDYYEAEYNDENDYTDEHDGNFQTVVDQFDKFLIHGTEATIGLGGFHSAIPNYKGENLWLLDYRSLYPSIIIAFAKYFGKIIDIELYKSLYNYRNFDIKPLLNNKNLTEAQKSEIENLSDGAKLLLNSLFGLINSEFNFSFANKELGRFICLFGQYLIITLSDRIKKYAPDSNLVNLNTDGIYVDNITEEQIKKIIEESNYDMFYLDVKKVDKLIQYDVNNYIKIENGEMKTKGNTFHMGIKHIFVNHENKIPVNINNALRYINNKSDIKVEPILFRQKNKRDKISSILLEGDTCSMDKIYYLTSKDKGRFAIKNITNPLILSIEGEIMYFTENEKNADIREYIKFARLTEKRILEFRQNKTEKKEQIKYYPYKLTPDTKENNQIKKSIRTQLCKIFEKDEVCINGFEGDYDQMMHKDGKPIPILSNYTMTQIRDSQQAMGFSITNYAKYNFVFTKDMEDIAKLDKYDTFKVESSFGHLYVFKNFNTNETFNDIKFMTKGEIPVHLINGMCSCNLKPLKNIG